VKNVETLAVCKVTALKMFWFSGKGLDNEAGLLRANELLSTLEQPTPGYYRADQVSELVDGVQV